MEKYIVMTRYEYWGESGIQFTDWFNGNTNEMTKDEALEYIKETKKRFGDIDKKTHLNHEYKLITVDEWKSICDEYQKQIDKFKERDEKYYASDKWKELKHKKYIARKERKKHQEEYNKMMAELSKS